VNEHRFTEPTPEEIDWSRPEDRQTTMAVSRTVRMSPHTFARLHTEADRRGVGVTTLMRELIESGLAGLDRDRTVTVRLADLHRAIDVATARQAA
jgi:predicted DNA-binding protein